MYYIAGILVQVLAFLILSGGGAMLNNTILKFLSDSLKMSWLEPEAHLTIITGTSMYLVCCIRR